MNARINLAHSDAIWFWIAVVAIAICLILLVALLQSLRTSLARSNLRRRLDEVERLKDLSVLGGGLAHEIRQPVSSMQFALASAAERLRRLPACDDRTEIENILDGILGDLKRLEEITNAFLLYARPEAQEATDCDVREACEFVRRFVRVELGSRNITLATEYPRESTLVHMPEVHLRQILVNLILNAAQASQDGSTVSLRVIPGKGMVAVELEDRGCGVPGVEVGKLFRPFHTTRPKGVGLGLALSRRFARDAGGDLRYYPAKPKGSVFSLELPVAKGETG